MMSQHGVVIVSVDMDRDQLPSHGRKKIWGWFCLRSSHVFIIRADMAKLAFPLRPSCPVGAWFVENDEEQPETK